MIFKKQLKVSSNFGEDYIKIVIEELRKHFPVDFIKVNEIEIDLIIWDYMVNKKKVSFLSEGQIGTFIIGRSKDIKHITNVVNLDNSDIFELVE